MASASIAAIICLASFGAFAWEAASGRGSEARPLVLLITLDTVRADHLGCYGYSRTETPNIDRLAADGLRFANAYAPVPITLPSHAVILTGTYPMLNGVRDFTSTGLSAGIPTLAEVMLRNGYRTAAFVSSFALNSMWGLNRGFEIYDDNVGGGATGAREPFLLVRPADQTVDRMLDWLRANSAKPFFIWLHLYDAHSPYRSPEPYRSRYKSLPYDGAIAFDDEQVGRVMNRLRDLGLYDNTLIVLAGDHGESLGEHGESEHGFFIYNATLRVPLTIKLPRSLTQGKAMGRNHVVAQPVGLVDVTPTIAQACKIPASASFQGRSLLGSMRQDSPSHPGTVYAESYYPRDSFGWRELHALITPDFKYIDAPRAELYDLRRDPEERENIIVGHLALARSLREELSAFEQRFRARGGSSLPQSLDPEVLEKLKALGYVSYKTPVGKEGGVDEDPKDKVAVLQEILRAGDLTRLGKYSEADQLLAGLEEAEPGLYVVPFQRGENDLGWGKPQLASEEFRKSLARNPAFDQAALGLGQAYLLMGQDDQAATALGLALDLNPRNFLAGLALARVYWRQNAPDRADALLARLVRVHPGVAEVHADYGISLTKLKRYQEALPELQRAVNSGYEEAIAFNYLGIALAETGHPSQAIQSYTRAVELDSRYAAAFLNLAFEYLKQGAPTQARDYYHKVCELSDDLCRQYASRFPPPSE